MGKGVSVSGETRTTRDNVIFELGLMMGTLGRERCFALLPAPHDNLHILTDYLGMNYCTYIATKESGISSMDAVFGAAQEIGQRIKELLPRQENALKAFLGSQRQAVVVYPHIIFRGGKPLCTLVHRSLNATYKGVSVEKDKPVSRFWWNRKEAKSIPNRKAGTSGTNPHEETLAHFDDLLSVSEIAELCGRMQLNVIATRDGIELGELKALRTVSFGIGLCNGFTAQAFDIISEMTCGRIRLYARSPSVWIPRAFSTLFCVQCRALSREAGRDNRFQDQGRFRREPGDQGS